MRKKQRTTEHKVHEDWHVQQDLQAGVSIAVDSQVALVDKDTVTGMQD
jgi:hypothetical protein